MWEFIIGFLLGIYFWRCWTHPRTRSVKPGLNSDITLPHDEELELHHNMLSSCSQKVRACLGETGLKHRKIHHILPSSGSWETKKADYLNNINPAGTVPVLIHNGHPIYESHEQIVYIDQVLMPGGPKLTPTDPGKKALMDKWVESGSMIMSEVISAADPWDGLSKRFGNMLGPMTMPLFCANMILHFDMWNVLETISMIPLLKEHFFVVLLILFKTLGVETFIKVKKVGSLVSPVRRGLNHHMAILTKDLEASGGPYICGDSYTLADVSMVPIFERMEYGRWWTNSLKTQFPLVTKYWEAIQEREGYKASKPDMVMHNKLLRVGKLIDQWKKEHTWFNDFYEN
jgi:glutathione S-transferase